MGVLDSQQPQFGGYRLPTGEYDYGLLTEHAGSAVSGLPDPRGELEGLWQSVFAVQAACEDLYKQGKCSLDVLHAVEADRAAIEQAFAHEARGLSVYDALQAGIEAVAAAGVGSNRIGAGALRGNFGGSNVADGPRLQARLAAEELAGADGHAFRKHVVEQGGVPRNSDSRTILRHD
jgi:hypothetical protein